MSAVYPGFMRVEANFKVGDYVYFDGYSNVILECIIESVDTLADAEDNFESSYRVSEVIDGIIKTDHSHNHFAYESELKLNEELVREMKLKKLLNTKINA